VVLGAPAEDGLMGSVAQRVEWETPGRDGYASYTVSTLPGEQVDEDSLIVQAVADSPVPVTLERRPEPYLGPSGIQWNPLGIAHLVLLLLLITGPQPRRATKWAWFWLSFLPLGWVVSMATVISLWAASSSPFWWSRDLPFRGQLISLPCPWADGVSVLVLVVVRVALQC